MQSHSDPIPFFDYKNLFSREKDQYTSIFNDVLSRGAFIQQRDLEKFEQNLAAYLGVKYAYGVANATDGLIMAWRAVGLQPGDEVIFSSHTMVATAAAVHFAGGIPVPADCGPDHLMDPSKLEKLITPKTKGISPVQLNGRTCDMDAILSIARRHNLDVIEDSAQALGSRFKGKLAGTFGRVGVFSFFPAKLLGCMGDGGAVVTNDDEIAEKIALLRDHGRSKTGEVVSFGLNSRLDNLQAAILDYQLQSYDQVIARRRKIATMYTENLQTIKSIVLPPAPLEDGNHFDVYQNYEIEAENRDQLKEYLQQHGIGTIIQWGGKAVHQFAGLGMSTHLEHLDRIVGKFLLLPMNIMLTDAMVLRICEVIRSFYKS